MMNHEEAARDPYTERLEEEAAAIKSQLDSFDDGYLLDCIAVMSRPHSETDASEYTWQVFQQPTIQRAVIEECMGRGIDIHLALTGAKAEVEAFRAKSRLYKEAAAEIDAKAANLDGAINRFNESLLAVVMSYGKASKAGNYKLDIGGTVYRSRKSERYTVRSAEALQALIDGWEQLYVAVSHRPRLQDIKKAITEGSPDAAELIKLMDVTEHHSINY